MSARCLPMWGSIFGDVVPTCSNDRGKPKSFERPGMERFGIQHGCLLKVHLENAGIEEALTFVCECELVDEVPEQTGQFQMSHSEGDGLVLAHDNRKHARSSN